MEYIRGTDFRLSDTVVAFGCFDGLHAGHRRVLEELALRSGHSGRSALLYLDRSPCGRDASSAIYTEEETRSLLGTSAPDYFVSLPFDSSLSGMEPEEFVREILCGKLGARTVVTGTGIRFGRNREGSIETLKNLAEKYGYSVAECGTVERAGQPVSSDWIRRELEKGSLETANELLGHPFTIWGEVVHGKALGRTVGMPTANLKAPENKTIPVHGVYGTLSKINGRTVMGLTNIGRRPSVDAFRYVTIETFLLDFNGDIYGKTVALELHAFIRGVMKFSNLDEVKRQVEKDIRSIRSVLEAKSLP